MLTRYAIIDGLNVVNVIDYEQDPGNPPPGFENGIIAVQSDLAGPGWIYDNGQFIDPTPPPPPMPALNPLTPEEKLAAAGLTVDDLKTLLGLQ